MNESMAQSLSEELKVYVHAAAYDLKSPLSTIVSFSKLLQRSWPTEVQATVMSEDLLEYVNIIAHNANKMNRTLQDLLWLDAVRELAIQTRPLDMEQIVGGVLQQLKPMVREHSAQVILPQTWPVARGYDPWIAAIWRRYIVSAIEQGGRPPRVELGGENHPLSSPSRPETVRFWVRDNGPGIPLVDQTKVFVPLDRLDSVRDSGTYDLGLSVIQRAVERMEGQVGVESQSGLGSTFYFTLPA
jgi:two-component system, sensor histidine kinase and response regulator